MRYTIDKSFLGSEKNLLVDSSKLEWTDIIEQFHFSGDQKSSLDLVLDLQNISVPEIPVQVKSMCSLIFKNHDCQFSPWKKVVTNSYYKNWLIKITEHLNNSLSSDNIGYYKNNWIRHNFLFESLHQSKIDHEKLKNFLLEKNANKTNLMSFFPNKEGYAQIPVYDRLSTRTGRLKITTGPSILLLKKEHRKILKSRFEGGKIVSVDYSSLEARIAYQLKNKKPADDDLYSYIGNQIGGEFERYQVKLATISLLYGMNENSLISTLGGKEKAKLLLKEIKRLFKIKSLEEELRDKAGNSSIKNYYGRCIHIPEDRLIVNTYIQSTGVDVALHGFTNLVEKLKETPVKPLFVLHDALILDVPHGFNLSNYTNVAEHIPGWDVKFPIHISDF